MCSIVVQFSTKFISPLGPNLLFVSSKSITPLFTCSVLITAILLLSSFPVLAGALNYVFSLRWRPWASGYRRKLVSGCGFESWHRRLDGFTFICSINCINFEQDRKALHDLISLKMGHSRPLFSFTFVFSNAVDSKFLYKYCR